MIVNYSGWGIHKKQLVWPGWWQTLDVMKGDVKYYGSSSMERMDESSWKFIHVKGEWNVMKFYPWKGWTS